MIEEETIALVSILKAQWARVWDMWKEMLSTIPDGEWSRGDIDYLVPARQLIHSLVCADVFTADIPLDQYDPARMFGGTSWGMSSGGLPSKETALEKLTAVRAAVEERLAKLDDAALLEPEKPHPWAGQTRMCKMLYVLRHTQHHLGEVTAELSRRGIRVAAWEKEKAAKSK